MAEEESACLDDETLEALVAGTLDPTALPSVEGHLAQCGTCRSVLGDAVHGAQEPQAGEQEPDGALEDTALGLPATGEVLAEKYRIEGFLGRGGMGVVLAARHLELGHRVAIKVLNSSDSTAAARFLREAKTCASLVNEHIARVFDLGRLPNGVPYFVMEHLVGDDLARVIAREPVSIPVAIDIVLQTCDALGEAHAAGVIHRDLKPSNLFVTRRSDGTLWIKVLDFGISKLVAGVGAASISNLTVSQSVVGSPLYMSPEQLRATKTLDVRSDIWSLGVILYELLTRHRPFSASTWSALLISIATEAPPRPSSRAAGLPEEIEAVVLRCLEKEPAARFASVAALADALRPLKSRTVTPETALERRWRRWRRQPRRLVAVGGLLVASLSVMGFALFGAKGSSLEPKLEQSIQQSAALPNALPLVVRCDRPLPSGTIRLLSKLPSSAPRPPWQAPLAVGWVCDAETSEARRAELSSLLSNAPALAGAELEPAHPFYALRVEQTPGELQLGLTRSAQLDVGLELKGPRCKEIASVRVRAAESSGAAAELRLASPDASGGPCRLRVTLPFEAFGKRHSFSFEPAGFRAEEAVFSSAQLAIEVQRSPRRVPSATPEPCVPPRYCRD